MTTKPSGGALRQSPSVAYPFPQWIDLSTTDIEGSCHFYRHLFGWDFRDTGYEQIAHFDGRPVCALWPPGFGPEQATSYWHVYHGVPSLDSAQRSALKLGSEILLESIDYRGIARVCTVRDPAGASLSMWESTTPWPFITGIDGTFVWAELAVEAPTTVAPFYRETLGLETGNVTTLAEDYRVFVNGEQLVSGATQTDTAPHWRVYFATRDIARAIQSAEHSGGQLLSEPTHIGIGITALMQDPQGATFGLLQGTTAPAQANDRPDLAADDNAGYPVGLSL